MSSQPRRDPDSVTPLNRTIRALLGLGALLVLLMTPSSRPVAAGLTVLCSAIDSVCVDLFNDMPGAVITQWNAGQYTAATAADFQAFDVIYFGDAFASDPAIAAKEVYGSAINGRAVVTGAHFEHCTEAAYGPGSPPCVLFDTVVSWILQGTWNRPAGIESARFELPELGA